MKKENEEASKNKWGQLLKKKWFFPAVYLTIAAVLLTTVVWYQNIGNQIPDAQNKNEDDFVPNLHDEDAKPVTDQQEMIQMPIAEADQAEIVTKFYDYNAEEKEQENGLILFNNRFYQSTGIGIGKEDKKTFDVVASLSGEVIEVKEDPLLGNVVVMSHKDDVKTYYASLGDVEVDAGQKVKQGEMLGTAGKSLFTKENGIHVHFELRKDGIKVNPEEYFNQPMSKLDGVKEEQEKSAKEAEEKADSSKESDESKSEESTDENDINIDTDKKDETDAIKQTDDNESDKDEESSKTKDDSKSKEDSKSKDDKESTDEADSAKDKSKEDNSKKEDQ